MRVSQTMENSSAMRVNIATPKAQHPRPAALRFGQAPDKNRDEDDVVDAENDLERRQGTAVRSRQTDL